VVKLLKRKPVSVAEVCSGGGEVRQVKKVSEAKAGKKIGRESQVNDSKKLVVTVETNRTSKKGGGFTDGKKSGQKS